MAPGVTALPGVRWLPLGSAKIAVSPAHTFGTDAVLLAHFSAPKKSDTAVDLCTGCGVIPLLWLQRGQTAGATGVDIAPEAIALARQSAAQNGLQGRVRFLTADLKNPFAVLPKSSFSLVTCNPPYFTVGAGPQSKTPASQTARHEVCCTLFNVIQTSAALLRFGGRLALCQRPERLSEVFTLMSAQGIEPKRLQLVCKNKSTAPWLVLVEGRRGGKPGLTVLPNLILYENGRPTPALQAAYGPFWQFSPGQENRGK